MNIKIGLEIHQQLDSHKLFCSCPSRIRQDVPDFTLRRRQRAVVGETGEKDIAALHEEKRSRLYIYEGYYDTNCLVETDEEPPHAMNQDALDIALQIALLLNAKPVNEIQVMRKTVVDGSNTSGFQRTALIATGGSLELEHKGMKYKVAVPTIMLEEDAARKIKEEQLGSELAVTYRLDRLGIPEIEIATSPDIDDPELAKKAAEKLGLLLRSCKVRRGLGTIRQDINVSLEGGSRTELKLVQDLGAIPKIVQAELMRQQALVSLKHELVRRNAGDFRNEPVVLSSKFEHTSSELIKNGLEHGIVLGMKLPKMSGLLGFELQPNRRFGTELSEYAKSSAGVSGILHSDELPGYGITDHEVHVILRTLNCYEGDAFVLVVDNPDKAAAALRAVTERCKLALRGVPREVRGISGDNSSNSFFMRPIPGSARLYPETDIHPISVSRERIDELRKALPKTLERRANELEEKISRELAQQIIRSEHYHLFNRLVDETGAEPRLIASTLLSTLKDLTRRGIRVELKDDDYVELFKLVAEGKLVAKSIPAVLEQSKPGHVSQVALRYQPLSEPEIEHIILGVIEKHKDEPESTIMGYVMREVAGRASGEAVSKLIKRLMEK